MKQALESITAGLFVEVGHIIQHIDAQAKRIAELERQLVEYQQAMFDAGQLAAAPAVELGQPVAQVAEDCIFLLRKQPNGDRWPVGMKLYTAPLPADTDKLREAILALPLPDAWFRSTKRGGMLSEDGYSLAQVRALLDAVADLAASTAVQAPVREVPGWKPIETAPKDGTMFIGWVRSEIYPDDEEGYRLQRDNSTADFCQWCDFETGGCFIALAGPHGDSADWITHWMPLPAAPVQTEQKP